MGRPGTPHLRSFFLREGERAISIGLPTLGSLRGRTGEDFKDVLLLTKGILRVGQYCDALFGGFCALGLARSVVVALPLRPKKERPAKSQKIQWGLQ